MKARQEDDPFLVEVQYCGMQWQYIAVVLSCKNPTKPCLLSRNHQFSLNGPVKSHILGFSNLHSTPSRHRCCNPANHLLNSNLAKKCKSNVETMTNIFGTHGYNDYIDF